MLNLGKVIESDPALSARDIVKLLQDLLLSVTSSFDSYPELLELLESDLPVLVDINLVEELTRWNLAKGALPMLNSLILIDGIATIDIEDAKDFVHFGQSAGWQVLEKQEWSVAWVIPEIVVTDCEPPIDLTDM